LDSRRHEGETFVILKDTPDKVYRVRLAAR
jgi:hypothetical protein